MQLKKFPKESFVHRARAAEKITFPFTSLTYFLWFPHCIFSVVFVFFFLMPLLCFFEVCLLANSLDAHTFIRTTFYYISGKCDCALSGCAAENEHSSRGTSGALKHGPKAECANGEAEGGKREVVLGRLKCCYHNYDAFTLDSVALYLHTHSYEFVCAVVYGY